MQKRLNCQSPRHDGSPPQGLISDRVEPVPTVRQEGGRSLLRSFGNRLSWFDKEAAPGRDGFRAVRDQIKRRGATG